MKRRDNPQQLSIDWGSPQAAGVTPAPAFPDPIKLVRETPPALVQRLPWDFKTTFPEPTEQALAAGTILDEDNHPENIKAIHDEHTREALATLHELDVVTDARRRGVDPRTGKPPRTHASREKLRQFLEKEPDRLEHHFENLMLVYEDAFGPEATQAFSKAIRAWHAGIPVEMQASEPQAPEPPRQSKTPASNRRRSPAVLPVPKPLPSAIAAKHFGEVDGKPIRPSSIEVRAITENHAEHLIELIDGLRQVERSLASSQCSDRARLEREKADASGKIKAAVTKYAESFGEEPAARLEAYAKRQLFFGGGTQRGR